jgi:hypothetical protein
MKTHFSVILFVSAIFLIFLCVLTIRESFNSNLNQNQELINGLASNVDKCFTGTSNTLTDTQLSQLNKDNIINLREEILKAISNRAIELMINKYSKLHLELTNYYCDPLKSKGEYSNYKTYSEQQYALILKDIKCLIEYIRKILNITDGIRTISYDDNILTHQIKCIQMRYLPIKNTMVIADEFAYKLYELSFKVASGNSVYQLSDQSQFSIETYNYCDSSNIKEPVERPQKYINMTREKVEDCKDISNTYQTTSTPTPTPTNSNTTSTPTPTPTNSNTTSTPTFTPTPTNSNTTSTPTPTPTNFNTTSTPTPTPTKSKTTSTPNPTPTNSNTTS